MSVISRRYEFLTRADIEEGLYELAAGFYPDYPDPLPAFQYLGGQHGRGLLESALAVPSSGIAGHYAHRTIFDKAAALFRSIIKNHPLLDGNKRLALTSTAVFLSLNGYVFYAPRREAVAMAIQVASSEPPLRLAAVARWFRRHSISEKVLLAKSPAELQEWFGSRGPVAKQVIKTMLFEIRRVSRQLKARALYHLANSE